MSPALVSLGTALMQIHIGMKAVPSSVPYHQQNFIWLFFLQPTSSPTSYKTALQTHAKSQAGGKQRASLKSNE